MSKSKSLEEADRYYTWQEIHALVTGLAVTGFSCADALLELGAKVTVVDESTQHEDKAKLLRLLGAEVITGPGAADTLPEDVDLVVTSPGWCPTCPILSEADRLGIPIWGDIELAWRLQQPDRQVPWLAVTGTNGKTTTTQMLTAIMRAEGLKVAEVGNIGRPVIEAIQDEEDYDLFVLELSAFQLHYTSSLACHSAAVLNVEEDHLEWYQDIGGFEQYKKDKAKIYERITHSCVYNVEDPVTEQMVMDADVVEGARAIGFTVDIPSISMFGYVDDLLVDRAFISQRDRNALPIASSLDLKLDVPHNRANAAAAAALARSYGVKPESVARGLQEVQLSGHRIDVVAEANGIRWIDDSKATNPHAADAAMKAFESFVWIAGGQTKGTSFDELVKTHAHKMRAAIVFGVDRGIVAESLQRHAPEVPVRVLDSTEDSVMAEVVRLAGEFAQAGDVVLLAPGGASLDMYSGYAARGDSFAKAVQEYIKN